MRVRPVSVASGLALAALVAAGACETVTVVVVEVASVDVSPEEVTLLEGEERALQAVPRASDGTALSARNVVWSSNTPGVARVDGAGRVQAVGVGEAVIRASLEGESGTSAVTVLRGPRVALSTADVLLTGPQGATAPSVDVDVTNSGAGVLAGLSLEVSYPDGQETDWLTAGLNGTTAPTSLTLTASAEALKPGTYDATVTVRSPSGRGSAAAIAVTFEVELSTPSIELDADVAALVAVFNGQQPATQSIGVTNGGEGTLTGLAAHVAYAATGPSGWLEATFQDTTAPTVLRLSASPSDLDPGVYLATVEVSSPVAVDGPRDIAVVFTVATPVAATAVGSSPAPSRKGR